MGLGGEGRVKRKGGEWMGGKGRGRVRVGRGGVVKLSFNFSKNLGRAG